MPKQEQNTGAKSQADKFKEAARELETANSEKAFDRVLKKVAKAEPQPPRKKPDTDGR